MLLYSVDDAVGNVRYIKKYPYYVNFVEIQIAVHIWSYLDSQWGKYTY